MAEAEGQMEENALDSGCHIKEICCEVMLYRTLQGYYKPSAVPFKVNTGAPWKEPNLQGAYHTDNLEGQLVLTSKTGRPRERTLETS